MNQTSSTTEPPDVGPPTDAAGEGARPAGERADEPPGTEPPGKERVVELRLARLHLRTGSYALARVELETAAGAGTLDEEALLDLAEVRWRTDDLTGAGEAAAAYLASGRVALIALVVAAEATAALGRPGEARRLAGLAGEMADGSMDEVFAGMPRSDVWPARPVERVAAAPVAAGEPAAAAGSAGPVAEVAVPMASMSDTGRAGGEPMPDPGDELDAARAALAAGDRAGAAIRLSIVLRIAPTLAPAVLDVAAGQSGPEFDLVRGDALRLVGRESQAQRAFASAARQPADEPGTAAAGSEPGPQDDDPGLDTGSES
jgi:hypothetical protein